MPEAAVLAGIWAQACYNCSCQSAKCNTRMPHDLRFLVCCLSSFAILLSWSMTRTKLGCLRVVWGPSGWWACGPCRHEASCLHWPTSSHHVRRHELKIGCLQKSLDWMGYNTDKAVSRARGQSRLGRKRTRSEGPAGMDVDGVGDGDVDMEPPKKRIHSSKSRCSFCPVSRPEPQCSFFMFTCCHDHLASDKRKLHRKSMHAASACLLETV